MLPENRIHNFLDPSRSRHRNSFTLDDIRLFPKKPQVINIRNSTLRTHTSE